MMMTPPRTTTTRVLALVAALACVLSCTHGAVTLQLAQSHVFPAPNRTWTLNDGYNLIDGYNDLDLHLVGARLALAIVEFGDVTNPTNPRTPPIHQLRQLHLYISSTPNLSILGSLWHHNGQHIRIAGTQTHHLSLKLRSFVARRFHSFLPSGFKPSEAERLHSKGSA